MQASRLKLLLALPALALTTACVTTAPKKTPASVKPTTGAHDKAGTKTQPSTATTPPATAPETAVIESAPAPTTKDLYQFVRVHSSPSSSFGPKEHELVAAMPSSPGAGTVEEAALALGLVKSVLHPLAGGGTTFQETDITGGDAARTVKSRTPTLEQLCKDRDVNLVDALIENPMLASHGVARQVLDAVSREGVTPEFRNEVMVTLKNQASLWAQVGEQLSAPEEQTMSATPVAPVDDSVPPNPADLRGGDSVLSEAQSLADRGDYQAAIKRAGSVDPSSPMHKMAQEKIREFSNLGVQDLRRKAAQAFQSAMPLTDRKMRAEYLQQAKGYLEQAITSYPQATQLPTVRDNLRVISRDLEKLQSEQQGG